MGLELLPPIFFSNTSRWVLETFPLPPASRPSTTFWLRGPTWRDSSPHRSMWPSLRPWEERLPGQTWLTLSDGTIRSSLTPAPRARSSLVGRTPPSTWLPEEPLPPEVTMTTTTTTSICLEAPKKRITEERLKAYHEKKSKKPALIAKTSVLLDIK